MHSGVIADRGGERKRVHFKQKGFYKVPEQNDLHCCCKKKKSFHINILRNTLSSRELNKKIETTHLIRYWYQCSHLTVRQIAIEISFPKCQSFVVTM